MNRKLPVFTGPNILNGVAGSGDMLPGLPWLNRSQTFCSVALQSNPVVFAAIVRESGQRRGADFRRWSVKINMRS